MKSTLRTLVPGLVIALGLVLATMPMWRAPGLSDSYDWWLHLKWQKAFAEALGEGRLWPSWIGTANGGWGAPVFVYYPPLAYYVFAGIGAFGTDPVTLVKGFVSLSLLLLAAATMLTLKSRCGLLVAAGSASFLLLSPTVQFMAERLNMYPSLLATATLPVLFAAVSGLIRSARRSMFAGAAATAVVAWTHVPTLFMGLSAGLAVAGFALGSATEVERRSIANAVAGSILGLGTAAALLLPAWATHELIHSDAAMRDVWDWSTNFLFDPRVSPQGFRSNYVFQSAAVGLFAVVSILALVLSAAASETAAKTARPLAWGSLGCCLLTSPVSAPVYAVVPGFEVLQFPWRWQAPAAVLAVMALGVAIAQRRLDPLPMAAAVVIGLAALGLSLDLSVTNRLIDPARRTSQADIRWAVAGLTADPPEFRTKAMGQGWRRDLNGDLGPTLQPSGTGSVAEISATHHFREWRVTTEHPQPIRLRTLCFPGWEVWIDGALVPSRCDDDGAIEADVPTLADARVAIRYTQPPYRTAGTIVSILSLLVLAYVVAGGRRLAAMTRRRLAPGPGEPSPASTASASMTARTSSRT